jgi:alkanesulfonate monooxygenase SsuD/methylene tetrahydromethanopterin reductase-like flavin-dependent oxidoreductase (luciferase family)
MAVRVSCSLPPGPEAPDHVALAEVLGYERAWFYDSPALYGDVWIAMARALDRTERIGVGTAVLVPSLRHVVTTAAAIGSLEAQAPGRLAVAIGAGVDALPGGAGWREEVERFPEAVRHLYVHEGHCFEATLRDRRHMSPELGATTFTGTPEQLRARRDALEDQGVEEIVYAPLGSDVPRELRAMAEALL